MEQKLDNLETKIDRIEAKIDSFIEKSSTNSTDISWLKGITRINFTMLATFILGLATWIIKSIFPK